MKRPHRHRAGRAAPDVDVTAFLSLMVILVPFLMITAVFSRMTILELEAAASTRDVPTQRDPLGLQVVVREHVIEVRHQGQEAPLRLTRTADREEHRRLAEIAAELKEQFPRSLQATLLLEPQIPYDELVQIMDTLRVRHSRNGEDIQTIELFPQITLGETPANKPRVGRVK